MTIYIAVLIIYYVALNRLSSSILNRRHNIVYRLFFPILTCILLLTNVKNLYDALSLIAISDCIHFDPIRVHSLSLYKNWTHLSFFSFFFPIIIIIPTLCLCRCRRMKKISRRIYSVVLCHIPIMRMHKLGTVYTGSSR